MADLFISCWHFFSKYTDIWERFSFIENYRLIILFAVFTLALFAGFFVFRIYFSITFFYAYVTGCVLLMSRFLSWTNVVAFFSVSGVVFSFLMFRATRTGGIVMCAVLGGMMGYLVMPYIQAVVISAILGIVICYFFPVHGICMYMALFGGLGISSLFFLPDFIGVMVGIICGVFQIMRNKDQKLFAKVYPDRVQYFLEKRRAGA